ncbi:hypothetical protein L1887_47168 [Cichorium endivia]|nr:hypothetical protein L1887_47168 [Cichorium endivia]
MGSGFACLHWHRAYVRRYMTEIAHMADADKWCLPAVRRRGFSPSRPCTFRTRWILWDGERLQPSESTGRRGAPLQHVHPVHLTACAHCSTTLVRVVLGLPSDAVVWIARRICTHTSWEVRTAGTDDILLIRFSPHCTL